jgi:hypothetical protein
MTQLSKTNAAPGCAAQEIVMPRMPQHKHHQSLTAREADKQMHGSCHGSAKGWLAPGNTHELAIAWRAKSHVP